MASPVVAGTTGEGPRGGCARDGCPQAMAMARLAAASAQTLTHRIWGAPVYQGHSCSRGLQRTIDDEGRPH